MQASTQQPLSPENHTQKPDKIRPIPGVRFFSIATITIAFLMCLLGIVAVVIEARSSYVGNAIWASVLVSPQLRLLKLVEFVRFCLVNTRGVNTNPRKRSIFCNKTYDKEWGGLPPSKIFKISPHNTYFGTNVQLRVFSKTFLPNKVQAFPVIDFCDVMACALTKISNSVSFEVEGKLFSAKIVSKTHFLIVFF